MSKQDRQAVRTAVDVEIKYGLGKQKSSQGLSAKQEERINQLSQTIQQYTNKTNGYIAELNERINNLDIEGSGVEEVYVLDENETEADIPEGVVLAVFPNEEPENPEGGGSGGLTEVAWEDVKNKPFGEEGLKIEWDGNPTDKFADGLKDILGVVLYKIGEPIETFIGSTAILWYHDRDMSLTITEDMTFPVSETGYLFGDFSTGAIFGAVSFGKDIFDLSIIAPGLTLEVDCGGIWAVQGVDYIKSIISADYSVKQLDEKYIPDNIARKEDIENIDLDNYYDKSEIDRKFSEFDLALSSAIGSGVLE